MKKGPYNLWAMFGNSDHSVMEGSSFLCEDDQTTQDQLLRYTVHTNYVVYTSSVAQCFFIICKAKLFQVINFFGKHHV